MACTTHHVQISTSWGDWSTMRVLFYKPPCLNCWGGKRRETNRAPKFLHWNSTISFRYVTGLEGGGCCAIVCNPIEASWYILKMQKTTATTAKSEQILKKYHAQHNDPSSHLRIQDVQVECFSTMLDTRQSQIAHSTSMGSIPHSQRCIYHIFFWQKKN